MIQSRGQENEDFVMVVDLIDSDLKRWKEDLLLNIFSPLEFNLIKAIPISLGGSED